MRIRKINLSFRNKTRLGTDLTRYFCLQFSPTKSLSLYCTLTHTHHTHTDKLTLTDTDTNTINQRETN